MNDVAMEKINNLFKNSISEIDVLQGYLTASSFSDMTELKHIPFEAVLQGCVVLLLRTSVIGKVSIDDLIIWIRNYNDKINEVLNHESKTSSS